MSKVCAVIFDLDNVLYDEQDYFFAAFEKIAAYLSERCGISAKKIYDKLVCDFKDKSSLYPRLFNDLIADCGLDQRMINEVLALFSSVKPDLRLFSGSEDLLLALKKQGIKLGLVTNGNVATQKNKVRLLGVERFFDSIIYAREVGVGREKPDPEAYRLMLDALGVGAEETICVGDNPFTDFLGAKALGIRTVRLQGGEFGGVDLGKKYEADVTISGIVQVFNLVNKFNGTL
jgi:putative hydrolase of the HAD superfamily